MKMKEIIFPGVDLAGVDHQQQIDILKKNKISNMNTITTTQNIFEIGVFIIMRILIRSNWMGY